MNSDKYMLDKSFQEILYRIEYVNISIYIRVIGSTYIELPDKLENPMKGLINIKNNYNKCFFIVILDI